MAQPSNTFDSYDAVGIREDLSDVIYNISPEETPFYTKCRKTTARNTFVEWQKSSQLNGEICHCEFQTITLLIRFLSVLICLYYSYNGGDVCLATLK